MKIELTPDKVKRLKSHTLLLQNVVYDQLMYADLTTLEADGDLEDLIVLLTEITGQADAQD